MHKQLKDYKPNIYDFLVIKKFDILSNIKVIKLSL